MSEANKTNHISRKNITTPEMIACEVCMKEVPASVAHSLEGDEYILNFCGIECHDKWVHEKASDNNKSSTN